MRIKNKKMIEEFVKTLFEAHREIRNLIDNGDLSNALNLLQQCQEGALQMGNLIEQSEGGDFVTIGMLEAYCEQVYEIYNQLEHQKEVSANRAYKVLNRQMVQVENSIKHDIKTQRQAVFLPYKASMWTALESIWMEADRDPDCEAIVIPVPYYELDGNRRPRKVCYEGDQFPAYVPITDFRKYSIETNHPEMIFIHNPYDDMNTVTYVLDQFHAQHLKAHTDCLVYSPYFIYGGYRKDVAVNPWFIHPGIVHSHKMIVQSEKLKEVFVKDYGYAPEKFLPVGSPKIDAVVNKMKERVTLPEEWREKLEGRKKVFLLNTHMLYFIILADYAKKVSTGIDYGIKYHREILEAITRHPECGLIWRPHPLMKAVMNDQYVRQERYKASLEFVEELEHTLENSDHCVIDRTADYKTAFYHSDAMISTYSSLIPEYMATGKPVLIFQTKQTEESAAEGFINYRNNYFKFPPDNVSFEKFINMVLAGEDPMKKVRMESIRDSFANLDGTAGRKAYQAICQEEWK